MINKINVTGIELYGYHGCMNEESVLGGKYIIDVELFTDFSKSAATDQLIDTIDYVQVRNIVVEEMAIRSKLIEHVGYRIMKKFKQEFTSLLTAKITVRKLNPPIQGVVKEVAIVIEG
ncbi:dihydroneopterin aldolase [Crocinitomix catalasitica]|uniref:dihydroneopterin aldolase n=1 Tax=Crocinitomix catalasitica TaxID=184607 RepID=UPI00055CA460|nr:dihydroneopterin aldolase [Crocinitomix catalasitica]